MLDDIAGHGDSTRVRFGEIAENWPLAMQAQRVDR